MKYRTITLALLTLLCQTLGAQPSIKWTPVAINAEYSAISDSSATRIISGFDSMLAPLYEVIGRSEDEYKARRPESGLSNFVADIIRERAEMECGRKVHVAMTNFGGIRTSLPKGDVTLYDILSIFPFKNRIEVFDIKGSDLTAFFERNAHNPEALSGVRLEVENGKVKSLLVDGREVDPERIYTFASIDFLMKGGDGVSFREKEMISRKSTGVVICTAVEDHIRALTAAGRTIRLESDGRVKYSSAGSAREPRLVILHTNDTHSQITQVKVGSDKGLGGAEQRLQMINEARKRYGSDKVLLLDGGDYDQGTPYFTMARGEVETALMNALGYDVATLGNHEFDNGQKELADRLSRSGFQTVTCNYDFSATSLKNYVKPYVIVNRGGMKIGIIGATSYLETCVFKDNLNGMKRLDTVKEVNKWAELLKHKEKCDLVILLSHLGYKLDDCTPENPDDCYMAAHSRDIDIIVGGHTHTYLKEAKLMENLDGKSVPIVQVGRQGCYVGKMEIY